MYKKNRHKGKKHYCRKYLQCFSQSEFLDNHLLYCSGISRCQLAFEMSDEGSKITFNNYCKQLLGPFVIYADFESIPKKQQDLGEDKSYTVKSQDHKC